MVQTRYGVYLVKVKEADERAAANARRWIADTRANNAERDERTMPMPKAATMPPEALAKTEALRRRMMGGA